MKRCLLLISLAILFSVHAGYAQEGTVSMEGISSREEAGSLMDIVIVLDNSGSMKENDPGSLTMEVVSSFLDSVPDDSRISFVIFAEEIELAMPLTSIAEEGAKGKIAETMDKVDYRGQFTNTAMAVERAIYELKSEGREDAEKLIILITDGYIDTGDGARDVRDREWLETGLAEESKVAGIRIFGIAFTERADFQLIQTLAQETEGGYYRALKVEDIQEIFNSINKAISKPKDIQEGAKEEAGEQGSAGARGRGKRTRILLMVTALAGLAMLAIIVIIVTFVRRSKRRKTDGGLAIPEAWLTDVSNVTNKKIHEINKRITKIGSVKSDGVDICIEENTISNLHAQIEYRDYNFYLRDLDSVNGTYLNKEMEQERITGEVLLRGGDIISFGQYDFQFIVPSQKERVEAEFDNLPGIRAESVPGTSEPSSQQPKDGVQTNEEGT